MAQACAQGACLLLTLPSSAFCSAVANRSAADRTHEDEILSLLEQTRAAGGITCGTNPVSAPVSAMRLDARLTCAARVFASDLAVTRTRSLTDSQGRDTVARLSLAGYTQQYWAESYTMNAGSSSDALSMMLADTSSCPQLVSSTYIDVGIGVMGDVYVVTQGAQ
jgi:uncharacterized protein YkwD